MAQSEERRAVMMVALRKAIYKGSDGEIPAGTMMRVETLGFWGVAEVSPINEPGRRISVSSTEVECVGVDGLWEYRTMNLLMMANWFEARGDVRRAANMRQRRRDQFAREGVNMQTLCAPYAQMVVYAGGGL